MSDPTGVATDCQGNTYVVDSFGNVIYRYSSAGVFSEAVGINKMGASLLTMVAVAADCSGNLYTTNAWINDVTEVAAEGVVTTLAGKAGVAGSADGQGTAASFSGPSALSFDSAGNLYVLDAGNNLLRRITPSGLVSTVAGTRGATALQLGALPGAWVNSVELTVSGHRAYVLADHAILTLPLPWQGLDGGTVAQCSTCRFT